MEYPRRIIKFGEADKAVVKAIVTRLIALGYPVDPMQDRFDAGLRSVVKLFQSHRYDAAGRFLNPDGVVGILTWGALFGADAVVATADGLAGTALTVAISQINVMERPEGSNRGREVEMFQASVGIPPGSYWCMAFVHWCFQEAAKERHIDNPFPRTGGVLDAWRRVVKSQPDRIVTAAAARADPTLIRPGAVFILDHGGGLGHTGFVKSMIGGAFRTVEGNSNPNGSSNGIGVFDIDRRKVTSPELKGFIDFTTA